MDEALPPLAAPGATPPLRVFYALWPDDETRRILVAMASEVAAAGRGRAPPPQNVHLTLAFVGDVAPGRLPALRAIGEQAAAAIGSFRLDFDRIGTFRDSGIAWIGTSTVAPPLQALVDGLGAGLAANGFPVERRPFRAHVTLARRCARPPAATTLAVPIVWPATRIVLNASELAPGGSRYSEVDAWPLGAPAP